MIVLLFIFMYVNYLLLFLFCCLWYCVGCILFYMCNSLWVNFVFNELYVYIIICVFFIVLIINFIYMCIIGFLYKKKLRCFIIGK